jgi:hypothetical protein
MRKDSASERKVKFSKSERIGATSLAVRHRILVLINTVEGDVEIKYWGILSMGSAFRIVEALSLVWGHLAAVVTAVIFIVLTHLFSEVVSRLTRLNGEVGTPSGASNLIRILCETNVLSGP